MSSAYLDKKPGLHRSTPRAKQSTSRVRSHRMNRFKIGFVDFPLRAKDQVRRHKPSKRNRADSK